MFNAKKKEEKVEEIIDRIKIDRAVNGWAVEVTRRRVFSDAVYVFNSFQEVMEFLKSFSPPLMDIINDEK